LPCVEAEVAGRAGGGVATGAAAVTGADWGAPAMGAGAAGGVCARRSEASNVAVKAVTAIKAKTRPRDRTGAAKIRRFIAENPF